MSAAVPTFEPGPGFWDRRNPTPAVHAPQGDDFTTLLPPNDPAPETPATGGEDR